MSLLKAEGLGIQFGGLKAVDEFNFEMDKDQLYGLIGPNGAGKTTLLDAICGFTKPTSGKIIYNEKYDITKYKEYELVNIGIGRKFQVPSVFKSLTVYENMELAIKKNRNIFSSLFEKVTNQENQKIEEILQA